MRTIYNRIFKGRPLVTDNERVEMYGEFGREVFEEFLLPEMLAKQENHQLKQDLLFIGTFLRDKDKKHLSDRILKLIN